MRLQEFVCALQAGHHDLNDVEVGFASSPIRWNRFQDLFHGRVELREQLQTVFSVDRVFKPEDKLW